MEHPSLQCCQLCAGCVPNELLTATSTHVSHLQSERVASGPGHTDNDPPVPKNCRPPRTGVRQGPEDEGVLQALPGEVPPQARGQDRLPGAQKVDMPGEPICAQGGTVEFRVPELVGPATAE